MATPVNLQVEFLDGGSLDINLYDDVLDEDGVEEALEAGYLLYSMTPEDDGSSFFLVNLASVRTVKGTALAAEGSQDAAPMDAV